VIGVGRDELIGASGVTKAPLAETSASGA